jgi:dihydroxyacid dehydratase/phosphogluconate dehydratase
VALSDEAVAARAAAWRPPPTPYESGVFARYRACVGSASEGAILRPLSPSSTRP